MGEKRRKFTAEYKLETVRLIQQRQAAGVSLAAIGRELGINPHVLGQWVKQASTANDEPGGGKIFPGNGKLTSQDEELRRLRRENARLREERDILGKATAFFADKSRWRFAFIEKHRTEFKVTTMCRVLLVSKAGYYAWRTRPASLRARENVQLSVDIAGSQYAFADYQELLAAGSLTCSMSRKGNCWDNAVVESFFATLKKELVHHTDWQTREAARADVLEYIEVWYNRPRRHSSLGHLSQAQHEAEQLTATETRCLRKRGKST